MPVSECFPDAPAAVESPSPGEAAGAGLPPITTEPDDETWSALDPVYAIAGEWSA